MKLTNTGQAPIELPQLAAAPYERTTLAPGENEVADALWSAVKDNPGVKILLATKTLVVG